MPDAANTGTGLVGMARAYFRRHWQGLLLIRDRLRLSEDALHLLLAGIVGMVGGLIYLGYSACNQLIKIIAWGEPGEFLSIASKVEPWRLLALPALGGLAAGLALWFGLRLLGNPGLSNLLEVVVSGDGRLALRPAIVTALSSLLSISTGASIGREGLTMQLSATLASKLGQIARWPPYRLRLLVACGAAAGLAASCKAPVAGAVFAAQIVLGNFSMNLFAPLVFSSVIAAVLTRAVLGPEQWYEVPSFDFTRLTQFPAFVLLGVCSGFFGAAFLKLLRVSERAWARLPLPLYGRLAAAGLCVGALALIFPEVLGNGYDGTNEILQRDLPLLFVSGVLASRLLATVITVGAGTVGGVFTPTLFLGASFGSMFGGLLDHGLTSLGMTGMSHLPVGAFALVGMGSMLAATTHSPLLSMILIFELSLNYSIMPPLMLACVVSTLVARGLHTESVYTEPLRRKGLEPGHESSRIGAATERTVGDLLRPPVPPLRETASFREMADRFLTSSNNFLPVVDANQRLLGVIALQDLKSYLNAGQELDGVIAYDLMRQAPVCLTPTQKLSDVLPQLLSSELRNVPVVNTLSQFRLVGSLSRAEALGLLSEAISARTAVTE